jgi:hypothetical protein
MDYIIYEKDVEQIEKNTTTGLKSAWEQALPAVKIILTSAYRQLSDVAEDLVRLVFLKGTQEFTALEKYLTANLGTKPDKAKKIADQLQGALKVFTPAATAVAPGNLRKELRRDLRSSLRNNQSLSDLLDDIVKQWGIKKDGFYKEIESALTGGKDAIEKLPENFIKNFGWSKVRAYSIADQVAEKIFTQEMQPDAIRIKWQKTGNVDFKKAAAEGGAASAHQSVAPPPTAPAHSNDIADMQDQDALLASRIARESGIAIPEQNIWLRFVKAIEARLKDIRNTITTQLLLERKADDGGVGLSHEQSIRVTALIEKNLTSRSQQALHAILKSKKMQSRPEMRVLIPQPRSLQNKADARLTVRSTAQSMAQPYTQSAAQPIIQPSVQPYTQSFAQSQAQPLAQSSLEARPKIQDIVSVAQTKGPIEELSSMRLIDFRRLSTQAELAANKLRDRIFLLREDSFTQYSRGVQAWQSSPVYNMYIEKLKQGLKSGHMVFEPKSSDLSQDEFLNIIKLNQQISY